MICFMSLFVIFSKLKMKITYTSFSGYQHTTNLNVLCGKKKYIFKIFFLGNIIIIFYSFKPLVLCLILIEFIILVLEIYFVVGNIFNLCSNPYLNLFNIKQYILNNIWILNFMSFSKNIPKQII